MLIQKFFDRKYFIDKKFKVKYFRGHMTSSKYFCFEHISLATIFTIVTHYHTGVIDNGKLLILIATTL